MNNSILSLNEKKRQTKPLWQLICFSMFCFWQMGFIYFVGPSLTIDGKTPLPISTDNTTALIAVCYVLSVLWMIFFQKTIIHTQRIMTAAAILSSVLLLFPFPENILRLIIYIQVFCCCLLIGFETFIIVNFFSEKSNIIHLTLAYGIALAMIAFIQNDFFPISFPIFKFIMIIALLFLLLFFMKMPAGKDALPQYVTKKDGFSAPTRLLFGTYILVFVGALMGVSGPSISAEIKHGIFITYLTDAAVSIILYVLYVKRKIHPFKIIPFCTSLGCIGFLAMYVSSYVPALSYLSCALIGFGMLSCQMLPLYGSVIMKSYPSKYISANIILLSLSAVLVQGVMIETFRMSPSLLYLAYAVIMVILVLLFVQIEPFFLFTLRKRIPNKETVQEENTEAPEETFDPLSVLTPKEKEVAELICLGYTNADIAKILFISQNTVKDHTKKIYPKMNIHSRFELAAIVNRYRSENKE